MDRHDQQKYRKLYRDVLRGFSEFKYSDKTIYVKHFKETDLMPEIFCLTMLHPLNIEPIIKSLRENKKDLFIVEDHSSDFGIGSEIISKINDSDVNTRCYKIGSEPYPIPSVRSLEDKMLTTMERIISQIKRICFYIILGGR